MGAWRRAPMATLEVHRSNWGTLPGGGHTPEFHGAVWHSALGLTHGHVLDRFAPPTQVSVRRAVPEAWLQTGIRWTKGRIAGKHDLLGTAITGLAVSSE